MSEQYGYHVTKIVKGTLGEITKIQEELDELKDATQQGVKIMALVEMSDLIGAIEAHLEKYYPGIVIQDLIDMKHVTQRAFKSGKRS